MPWHEMFRIARVLGGAALAGACSSEPAPAAAEVPDVACPAGALAVPGGACIAPGVPPEACADGFEPDGAAGCVAVLPAEACSGDTFAVPGDVACQPLLPCGEGTWGDIPVGEGTLHVDAAASAAGADGSVARPFTTIAAAVAAAPPGALIAVAAGTYAEDVRIEDKAVRLWGRCPSLVTLVGSAAEVAALDVRRPGASGTELRGLALTGARLAAVFSGVGEVTLDGVWIRDTPDMGVQITDVFGPSHVTVRNTRIERTYGVGVAVLGGTMTMERAYIADLDADDADRGVAVAVYDRAESGQRGQATLRAVLVERARGVAVFATGSDVTLQGVLVRDTAEDRGGAGFGLWVEQHVLTGANGSATVLGSVFERNHGTAVLVQGATLAMDATVMRDTLESAVAKVGRGLEIAYDNKTLQSATATVERSLIAGGFDSAVYARGAAVTLSSLLIRDIAPGGFDNGVGLFLLPPDVGTGTTAVHVTASLIERTTLAGAYVVASELSLDASVIQGVTPHAGQGRGGRGINLQDTPEGAGGRLTLTRSRIARVVDVGVLVGGGDAVIEDSEILDVAARNDGLFGDGLVVLSAYTPATAAVRSSQIARSARVGMAVFGASATLEEVRIECAGIALNGEAQDGAQNPAELDVTDLGGNRCGCDDALDACVLRSTMLQPPAAL